jgi:hypothetical protein
VKYDVNLLVELDLNMRIEGQSPDEIVAEALTVLDQGLNELRDQCDGLSEEVHDIRLLKAPTIKSQFDWDRPR